MSRISPTSPPSALDKGRALEARMATYFAQNGYQVERNVVLAGRSGARHEIDVLAEKSDALTTFRVAVECKAWDAPVNKEVVAKAAHVAADLSLSKTIVVGLRGGTLGAEQTAAQLGVELWDGDEVQRRLGALDLAVLRAAPAAKTAPGFPCEVGIDQVAPLVARQAKRLFGRDEVVWIRELWLPWHLTQLAYSRHRRGRMQTARIWNRYDGLTGTLVRSSSQAPSTVTVDLTCGHLPVQVRAGTLQRDIQKIFGRWDDVVTDSAKRRHRSRLEEYGIPMPCSGFTFETTETVYQPLVIGLLRRYELERIVAFDGTTGRPQDDLGALLTKHSGLVAATASQPPAVPPG